MEEREERKKEKKKKRKRRQKLKDNTKGNTFLIFVSFFFFGDHFRFGSVFIKKKPNRFFLKQKITTGSSLVQFGSVFFRFDSVFYWFGSVFFPVFFVWVRFGFSISGL
jgi:hypothetical protein